MPWDYSKFKGTGGGTAEKPAEYSDQSYRNLQSGGKLGGSTLAERIIGDELKGLRPGTSAAGPGTPEHVSGTFFGDEDLTSGAGAGAGAGAGEAGAGSTGSLAGLQSAASANDSGANTELTPPSIRDGIGVRILPQDTMALAGLRRAY